MLPRFPEASAVQVKFGKTEHPESIDFTLPEDHEATRAVLARSKGSGSPRINVGCAKWNRQDLKNFYPRGTKDELTYYSTQFNSIELNATYYRIFPESVFAGWRTKTPEDFVFFPKIPQVISHRKRLHDAEAYVEQFLYNAAYLNEKLGTIFLQMPENFGPTAANVQRLVEFVGKWPGEQPLAVELRHGNWFGDPGVAADLYALFEEHDIANIVTDTAARRDLLHMRLTTPRAFVRYVGANHDSDYTRLDDWVDRLERWSADGVRHIEFFVHQNHELESPLLARYFVEQLNERLGCSLTVPATPEASQNSLF